MISAAVGAHVSRKLRVGMTLNRWINGYDANRVRSRNVLEEVRHTEFRVGGWNANLGVIVTPWEDFNLGAVAKAPFTADVELYRSYLNPFTQEVPVVSEAGDVGECNLFVTLVAGGGSDRGSSARVRRESAFFMEDLGSSGRASRARAHCARAAPPE